MSSFVASGGKVILTDLTPTAVTFTAAQIVFGSLKYSEKGTDVNATVQNGDIERFRQSISYDVSFDMWGDQTASTAALQLKQNIKCEVFEDDATTPLGTTFYGAVNFSYNESSETTTVTCRGNATQITTA